MARDSSSIRTLSWYMPPRSTMRSPLLAAATAAVSVRSGAAEEPLFVSAPDGDTQMVSLALTTGAHTSVLIAAAAAATSAVRARREDRRARGREVGWERFTDG